MKITRLEDGDFLVHIDCDLRSLAERKRFVAVDSNGVPPHPEAVPIIVRLARARKMVEMLISGTYSCRQELGDVFGMSQSRISRITRTAFLSPIIVEKVIRGQIPASKVAALADRLSTMPLWADQHKALGIA